MPDILKVYLQISWLNDIRSSDLLNAMLWKNLNDRYKWNKSVLIFKILNNHSAPNLKDKFIKFLKKTDANLSVRKPNTEYLKKVLDTVGLCYGIIYLCRQIKQNLQTVLKF